MSDSTSPSMVFKIVTRQAWEHALSLGVFTGSPDDARDGFIHLSAADQLTGTANRYFSSVPGLVLVAFRTEDLSDGLKWELSRGGALFPHYYGALPAGTARWVCPLPLDADGRPRIDEALQSKADA